MTNASRSAIWCCAIFLACSNGASDDGDGAASATSSTGVTTGSTAAGMSTSTRAIGAEGGTVVSVDGRARLVVPPGAVREVITFSIDAAGDVPGGHLGAAYEIGPTGTQFLSPAQVVIAYEGAPDPSSLRVATVEGGSWVAIPGAALDTGTQEVAGETSHLSPFALIAIASSGTGGAGGDGGAGGAPPSSGGGGGGEGGSVPAPEVLVASGTTPYSLARGSDGYVYWTDFTAGFVARAPVTGGPVETLVSGLTNPAWLRVDATNVYWTSEGEIRSVPLAGGASSTLATGLGLIGDIRVDGSQLYFSTNQGISSVSVTGGTVSLLVTAVGDVGLFAKDASSFYWVGKSDGSVRAVPVGGGTPTILATGPTSPQSAYAIEVSSSAVYWAVLWASTAEVLSVPIAGGSPTTLASMSQSTTTAFAIDDANAYFVASGIKKVPLAGGTVSSLPDPLPNSGSWIYGIALDSTSAYWTTADLFAMAPKGRIIKMTPK